MPRRAASARGACKQCAKRAAVAGTLRKLTQRACSSSGRPHTISMSIIAAAIDVVGVWGGSDEFLWAPCGVHRSFPRRGRTKRARNVPETCPLGHAFRNVSVPALFRNGSARFGHTPQDFLPALQLLTKQQQKLCHTLRVQKGCPAPPSAPRAGAALGDGGCRCCRCYFWRRMMAAAVARPVRRCRSTFPLALRGRDSRAPRGGCEAALRIFARELERVLFPRPNTPSPMRHAF